jgi:hypothetical protein
MAIRCSIVLCFTFCKRSCDGSGDVSGAAEEGAGDGAFSQNAGTVCAYTRTAAKNAQAANLEAENLMTGRLQNKTIDLQANHILCTEQARNGDGEQSFITNGFAYERHNSRCPFNGTPSACEFPALGEKFARPFFQFLKMNVNFFPAQFVFMGR